MLFVFVLGNEPSFEAKVRRLAHVPDDVDIRDVRACDTECSQILFAPLGVAVAFMIVAFVIFLLLLGVLKGLVGLYICPPIGMCGLGVLIDLPRPLDSYQEPELQDFPVIYDIVGWPLHPQTGKRSVRAISTRTEFCLNVIFFLTYPFIMLINACTYICFKKTYDVDEGRKQYTGTHAILLNERPPFKCNRDRKCDTTDGYGTEDADTSYVYDQMSKSEHSLKKK